MLLKCVGFCNKLDKQYLQCVLRINLGEKNYVSSESSYWAVLPAHSNEW